ncbi:Hypothetical Protein RradSPS_2163 [Rubrobacter radiotolerans]|uniref:N-acetyltransferase domain-containing protein n=1 Tax=Rubrobacter radiotolerans TaxID=42256 RepID=A0A023X5G1_RUBRA|nr:hypothetical protein [Rubrobacter radiotolerans]AHY47446.1 Hypothetical Protein RradSPS_2163 [Rubrobacter radiotolerans]MDX5894849.1 hypothetical protein [Rubrobacter radiotolerans]SMC06912.1 conserved hypothetical protein [Rubrobacter radiotolerans DSM 5868]
MDSGKTSPDSPEVFTLAERPGLADRVGSLDPGRLPEFLRHDPINRDYWSRLYTELPEFQIGVLTGSGSESVVAAGYTAPVAMDPKRLPDRGWDAALEGAFRDREVGRRPNLLCALLAVVGAEHQRRGLSALVLREMRKLAARHGFDGLVAPVRPSLKHRYPLVPMERYALWRREPDGLLFDPWLRTHERLGAQVVGVAPGSMEVTGAVADWERWTEMSFPESGEYVVEGALNPVRIDRERDLGSYIEPNVWMIHKGTN